MDDPDLRRALEQFLAARRALDAAYTRRGATQDLAELAIALELDSSSQSEGDESLMSRLQELVEENDRLRRLVSLLHSHSLRLATELDALAEVRHHLLEIHKAARTETRDQNDSIQASGLAKGSRDGPLHGS